MCLQSKTKTVRGIKSDNKDRHLFGYSALHLCLIQERWLPVATHKVACLISLGGQSQPWRPSSIQRRCPHQTRPSVIMTQPHILSWRYNCRTAKDKLAGGRKWLPACLCFVSSSPMWSECFYDRFSPVASVHKGHCPLSWAEQSRRAVFTLLSCCHLHMMHMIVIYTPPPSPSLLSSVWDKLVNSKQVWLLVLPDTWTPIGFTLRRLTSNFYQHDQL